MAALIHQRVHLGKGWFRGVWLSVVVLGFLAACQPAAPPYVPEFVPQECAMPIPSGYQVRCGTVTVPEDREKNSGNEVALAVAVVETAEGTSTQTPVIFLDGGPGGATLPNLPYRINLFRKVIAERPVIMFDQRGVGLTLPALDCPEVAGVQLEIFQQPFTGEEKTQKEAQALSACKQRFVEQGVSLGAYTTAASADDVHDIVTALGYPQVFLLGSSYGTRLAQVTILRHQDDGWIAGAILDSVVPLQVDGPQEFWANTQGVFKALFDRCAVEEACSKRYPDLEQTFYTTLEQLNANPLDVNAFDPMTGKSMTLRLDGYHFFGILFLMMYDPYQITKVPQVIDKVHQGDGRILKDMLEVGLAAHQFGYEGMNMSVQCADEALKMDLKAVLAAEAALEPAFQMLAEGSSERMLANCELWGVKPSSPAESKSIQTELPVLILSGSQDPITPAAWGRLLHESLPGSFFYEFSGGAHGILGTIGAAKNCADNLALAFLQNPTTAPDGTCVQTLKPARFAVPSQ